MAFDHSPELKESKACDPGFDTDADGAGSATATTSNALNRLVVGYYKTFKEQVWRRRV